MLTFIRAILAHFRVTNAMGYICIYVCVFFFSVLLFFLAAVFVGIPEFEALRASGSSTTVKHTHTHTQQLNNRDRETYALLLLDIDHNEWLLCATVASRFLYVFFFLRADTATTKPWSASASRLYLEKKKKRGGKRNKKLSRHLFSVMTLFRHFSLASSDTPSSLFLLFFFLIQ